MGITMVTTASKRREVREQGIEIQFPEYGDWVAIRPMDETFFFKHGMIPDFLGPTINEMIGTGQAKLPSAEKNEEWLTWLNNLVKWAFVSPKVVDEPHNDNEISIDDVGYTDKVFLYGLFGRPANVLRAFRDSQRKPVATVDAAKDNGRAPEPVVADNTVG
jgi:hypothetical protein